MKPKLKTRKVNLISDSEWDELVKSVYGKPYSFQQQDGCKERGTFEFSVPGSTWNYKNNELMSQESSDDYDEMGVSFQAWIDAIPQEGNWENTVWWERNFYPDVSMIIDDLYKKGHLEEGDYCISIDW